MQERAMSAAGAIVYWSPAEHSDGAKLREGLTAAGFEAFAPEARPAEAVLRDALECTVASPTMLVRPLDKGVKGFVVVQENRDSQVNEYEALFTTIMRPGGTDYQTTCLCDAGNDVLNQYGCAIRERWAALQDAFRPAQVSGCLVKVLGALAGIRLRPQGAIYWLPAGVLELWGKVMSAVEQAAFVGESARMYMVRTAMDADTVRAVHDAIVAEAKTEADTIDAEVMGGTLGARALSTRVTTAKNLRTKIKLYESILGTSLADLSVTVEKVEVAAAMAAMAAAADKGA